MAQSFMNDVLAIWYKCENCHDCVNPWGFEERGGVYGGGGRSKFEFFRMIRNGTNEKKVVNFLDIYNWY